MNVVIYARYSCDNQCEESIEGQLRECRAFAERNNYTLIDTYIDRAMSAKTDNRPEFQKVIKDGAKGQFNAIIVWKLDRFARNRYDSAHYKAMLRKNGVKVVSATEAISEGAEGIILESVLEGERQTDKGYCGISEQSRSFVLTGKATDKIIGFDNIAESQVHRGVSIQRCCSQWYSCGDFGRAFFTCTAEVREEHTCSCDNESGHKVYSFNQAVLW